MSRPLRILGITVLAIALTSVFVFLRFPYDRLAQAIESRAEQFTGLRLSIAELSPYIALSGAGLEAVQVRATPSSGETAVLESLRVRPAVSMHWLRGAPALKLEVESVQVGSIDGALVVSRASAWDGKLRGVDLAWVPFERIARGLAMTGRLDADADVSVDAEGSPDGPLEFEASDGSIHLPNIPVGIPFKTFQGKLELGGDLYARVDSLELMGPMVTANVSGTVGHAPTPGQQPLDLKLELMVRGRALRPVIQGFGVRLGRDGRAELQLTGTLSNPTFK